MVTDPLHGGRASWSSWAAFLQHHNLQSLAAWVLEAVGPLSLVGAQFLYLGSPLLNPVLPKGQMEALAGLLEDPEETQAFASFLRQGGKP